MGEQKQNPSHRADRRSGGRRGRWSGPLGLIAVGAIMVVALGGARDGGAVAVAAGAAAQATPVAAALDPNPDPDPCPDELTGDGSEPWIRAELYFGTTSPDGSPYPEQAWLDFLADEVTPRFPAGLTVLTGLGQWQGDDQDEVLQERSQLLIILFPADTAADSSALLEEIRDAYEDRFQQQSVLRADAAPVCTSF